MRKTIPVWLLICLLITAMAGGAQAETIFTFTTMVASGDAGATAVEAVEVPSAAAEVAEPEAAGQAAPKGARPEAPREVRIMPQDSALSVSWHSAAPGQVEDPVVKYVVTLDGDMQRVVIAAGDALVHTFEGLYNGRTYEVAVVAVSLLGETSSRVAFEIAPGITSEPTGAPPDGIPAKVTGVKAEADIRKGPGTSYPITDGVDQGDAVYIQETHGEWVQVLYDDGTRAGWLHENNVARD